MSGNAWRMIRSCTRFTFYGGCVLVVVLVVFVVGSFLLHPFSGFDGESEFTGLSGRAAERLLSQWPRGVDSADVQNVVYKSAYARDSHSRWYRIELSPDAASAWMDQIHEHQEAWSKQCVSPLHEGLEGVHRTISGPPPQHAQTGETPTWWTPPPIDFRATEVMLWYIKHNSGVGRATYSTFDEATGVLWMYDYASQHDILWPQGTVPTGDDFSTMKRR